VGVCAHAIIGCKAHERAVAPIATHRISRHAGPANVTLEAALRRSGFASSMTASNVVLGVLADNRCKPGPHNEQQDCWQGRLGRVLSVELGLRRDKGRGTLLLPKLSQERPGLGLAVGHEPRDMGRPARELTGIVEATL